MTKFGQVTFVALALCLSAMSGGKALAHAALVHASPSAGQTLDVAPKGVSIEFSTEVDLNKVELHVTDANGSELKLIAPEVQSSMGTTVIRGFDAVLQPGTYSVRWRVFSVDGHWTRGDYAFMVGE